jgi:hypothetical protein
VEVSTRYFDRYRGHDPLFCLNIDDNPKCVIRMGGGTGRYMMPVMNHFGMGNGNKCNW